MMNKLMLSCKAATRLIEEKQRRKLSLGEKMKLTLHNTMCDVCRHYEKQSRFLESLLKPREKAPVSPEIEAAAKELEEKIIRRLDSNQP